VTGAPGGGRPDRAARRTGPAEAAGTAAIPRRAVAGLAVAQLVAWGTTYYLVGVLGPRIAADLGGAGVVHAGFAAGLLAMGVASPIAGRLIDRHGGRRVMTAGAVAAAAGLAGLAAATSAALYVAAWLVVGVAMRLTLYDAAFAALARIGGPAARGPMAQVTLLGGLASTTFWPLGHVLADLAGWRGAVALYALLALATAPLYAALPDGRADTGADVDGPTAAPVADRSRLVVLGGLYAVLVSLTNLLNAGMSAHMIAILAGLGLPAAAAVSIASLRGIGQSLARLGEILAGGRRDPLVLNVAAAATLPVAFLAGLLAGHSTVAAVVFAFAYGVGNGLMTITRGTLPLVLFDHRSYGTTVGRLIAPSFLFSAAAPLIYAAVVDYLGAAAALIVSAGLGAVTLAAAIALAMLGRRP
jgi:hypothetical protein